MQTGVVWSRAWSNPLWLPYRFRRNDTSKTGDRTQRPLRERRCLGNSRSEVLDSEVTVFNATSALYQGTFSRQRGDGTEINRLTASYLVTDGTEGRRISVLAVHTP